MSYPPVARSHLFLACTIMEVPICQPGEQRFSGSFLRSTWAFRLLCLQNLWEDLIDPFLIISDAVQSADLLPSSFLPSFTWGHSFSTSAQVLQERPSPPSSGRLELVISASYMLLVVKRVYNMSTSRQICPAEYKSTDGAAHQLMVTGSSWCSNFTHKIKIVTKLSLPNKQQCLNTSPPVTSRHPMI